MLRLPSALLFMGIKIVTPERQKREMEKGRNWECSWINALCYDRRQCPSGARRGHGWAVSEPLVPSRSSECWPSIGAEAMCLVWGRVSVAREDHPMSPESHLCPQPQRLLSWQLSDVGSG